MQEKIIIRMTGKVGKEDLSIQNNDIKNIRKLIDFIEDLHVIFDDKRRANVSLDIQQGSAVQVFSVEKMIAENFNKAIENILNKKPINENMKKLFKEILCFAKKSSFNLDFSTSKSDSKLSINSDTEDFFDDDVYVNDEFYFYGIIKDIGGRSNPNIHIYTDENQYLKIKTTEDTLKNIQENILYKWHGINASGKSNIKTGKILQDSLEFIALIPHKKDYTLEDFSPYINRKNNGWEGVNLDDYIIRGYEKD